MTLRPQTSAEASLEEVISTFRRWLHLPDPTPLHVVLAAVVANLLPGDPVWVLLVGPPSSGKTELLDSMSHLSHVHTLSTFTEAGLLSGSRSRNGLGTGGLLREIGDFGIVVLKDFTSLLSEHHETRAGLLAALRELYDGHWSRTLGAQGGRTLVWQGKLGLLAGVTETIDRHTAVIGAMGERFVFCRIPVPNDEDRTAQGRVALANVGRETEMRSQLADVVQRFLAPLDLSVMPTLAEAEPYIVALADLATRCRSVVERDGHDRSVELVPGLEAVRRMTRVLGQLYRGLIALGLDDTKVRQLLVRLALDGMPKVRRRVVEALMGPLAGTVPSAAAVGDAISYPTSTTHRALEDLAAHGVVERSSSGDKHVWSPSAWLRQRWRELGLEDGQQEQVVQEDAVIQGIGHPRMGRGVLIMITHGTRSAYNRGCRCDECREATRLARARRARSRR